MGTPIPQVNLRPLLQATYASGARTSGASSNEVISYSARSCEDSNWNLPPLWAENFQSVSQMGPRQLSCALRDADVTSGEVITSALMAPFSGVGI